MQTFTSNGQQYKLRLTVGKAIEFRPTTEPTVDLMEPASFIEFWSLNGRGKIELLKLVCTCELNVDDMDGEGLANAMAALWKEIDFFTLSLSEYMGEALRMGMKALNDPEILDSSKNATPLAEVLD